MRSATKGAASSAPHNGTLRNIESDVQWPVVRRVDRRRRRTRLHLRNGGRNDEILFDDATGDDDAGNSVGRLDMNGGRLIADIVTHEGQFAIDNAPSTIVAREILFTDLGSTAISSQLRLDARAGLASRHSGRGDILWRREPLEYDRLELDHPRRSGRRCRSGQRRSPSISAPGHSSRRPRRISKWNRSYRPRLQR